MTIVRAPLGASKPQQPSQKHHKNIKKLHNDHCENTKNKNIRNTSTIAKTPRVLEHQESQFKEQRTWQLSQEH